MANRGDDDDTPQYRPSTSSSNRRHHHYDSQRVSRDSRPRSGESQRDDSQGYDEPANFANLDESAVSPPVNNPEDLEEYQPGSPLEQAHSRGSRRPLRSPRQNLDDAPQPQRPKSGRRRQRSSFLEEEGSLNEVAAPPPIQNPEQQSGWRQHRFLEDEERAAEETSDEDSAPYRPKRPEDYIQPKHSQRTSKLLTELYTTSYLVFFAFLGTLARLGVQWLTFYPGSPIVTPVIWANFGGSLAMGFLSEDQGLFRSAPKSRYGGGGEKDDRPGSRIEQDQAEDRGTLLKRKKTIPLYIGLATGFCGSFTSFSSFARDFFLALSDNLPSPIDHPHPGLVPKPTSTLPRNGGYSFEALTQVIIATLALSLGGLIAGAHLAIFLEPYTPRIHGRFVQHVVDPIMVLLAWGCWIGAVLLAVFPPDRFSGSIEKWRGEALFALVFAPVGCLLRFYASLKLNGISPAFPLGTFFVNMLGTAVEGMCYDIQHVGVGITGRVGGGVIGCQILQGVMDGFCGCLTTVSTWVSEINGLKRKHGWLYALGTILGGLGLMVVIMGSVRWSVGFANTACDTGYPSKVHG